MLLARAFSSESRHSLRIVASISFSVADCYYYCFVKTCCPEICRGTDFATLASHCRRQIHLVASYGRLARVAF